MSHFNPLNFLGFIMLGAALLWSVRLVYGARGKVSNDLLKRTLMLTGWLLVMGGILGMMIGLTGPFAVVPAFGFVVLLFAYYKYVAAERRMLLWSLSVAADKGIPLEQAARAFADERSVQSGVRTARLADWLERGAPLPNALALSKNPLPVDALLAARVGAETGQMAEALRISIGHADYIEQIMRRVVAQYFYIAAILGIGNGIMTFMMLKIVPVFTKMFDEFGLALPQMTMFVVEASNYMVRYWFIVFAPVTLVLFLITGAGISYYARFSRYELPLFSWIWRRCDGSLVMSCLALAVRQQRSIAATLQMLAHQYPQCSVGRRLARACQRVEQGTDWCDALVHVGLVTRADRAVLKSAERAGNLSWALDEMADSTLRRFMLRLRAVLGFVFPLVIILFGLTVGFIVISLFMPLIAMIQGLS
jgi:type II secretory pathway component PulF